jgi:hypothetical protein
VVGLSDAVRTVSLLFLGGAVAVLAVVIDSREVSIWFWLSLVLSIAALIRSAILGGKGVQEISDLGASGDWRTETSGGYFDKQTRFALAGVVLLIAAAGIGVAGEPRESEPDSASASPSPALDGPDAR